MIKRINKKRIFIYLGFAFGISWTTGLVIYFTGGLEKSPLFTIAGEQISLAYILLATVYMFGPAFANIITRVITKEGKADLLLQPNFENKRWVYYLAAWILPGILTIAGIIIFFILFPKFFDATLSSLLKMLNNASESVNVNPWMIVILQTIQALFLSPLLNALPTFGEEFGWRGYLQPKLMPLGGQQAVLLTGLIWGVWHWPVILMGHNYGLDYFGAPFLGPLAMVLFTLSLSVIFGWVTVKAGSVWPAVIAHGALNGIASLGLILVQGEPDPLLGPTPVGIIGGLGMIVFALLLLLRPEALKPAQD